MDASISDLRCHTKRIMQAIDRNETVNLYVRGKLKAQIVPHKSTKRRPSVMDDPIVGYCKGDTEPVAEKIARLRKPRYDF